LHLNGDALHEPRVLDYTVDVESVSVLGLHKDTEQLKTVLAGGLTHLLGQVPVTGALFDEHSPSKFYALGLVGRGAIERMYLAQQEEETHAQGPHIRTKAVIGVNMLLVAGVILHITGDQLGRHVR